MSPNSKAPKKRDSIFFCPHPDHQRTWKRSQAKDTQIKKKKKFKLYKNFSWNWNQGSSIQKRRKQRKRFKFGNSFTDLRFRHNAFDWPNSTKSDLKNFSKKIEATVIVARVQIKKKKILFLRRNLKGPLRKRLYFAATDNDHLFFILFFYFFYKDYAIFYYFNQKINIARNKFWDFEVLN